MLLYDNAFSPFARKVRLVLDHKRLTYDTVDGLALANHDALVRANRRIEVPALDDRGVLIVGSSDIVAYLERVHPENPVYPRDDAAWVRARAWERCADTAIDPILINLSYWTWAKRDDQRPAAWLEAGRRDLETVYAALEGQLGETSAGVCGELSIADFALFPHLVSTRSLGVGIEAARFPRLHAYVNRLRALPIFRADLERSRAFLSAFVSGDSHERRKIFWRGDRLEWILARGFHAWLMKEIEEDRVLWPGLGVPA